MPYSISEVSFRIEAPIETGLGLTLRRWEETLQVGNRLQGPAGAFIGPSVRLVERRPGEVWEVKFPWLTSTGPQVCLLGRVLDIASGMFLAGTQRRSEAVVLFDFYGYARYQTGFRVNPAQVSISLEAYKLGSIKINEFWQQICTLNELEAKGSAVRHYFEMLRKKSNRQLVESETWTTAVGKACGCLLGQASLSEGWERKVSEAHERAVEGFRQLLECVRLNQAMPWMPWLSLSQEDLKFVYSSGWLLQPPSCWRKSVSVARLIARGLNALDVLEAPSFGWGWFAEEFLTRPNAIGYVEKVLKQAGVTQAGFRLRADVWEALKGSLANPEFWDLIRQFRQERAISGAEPAGGVAALAGLCERILPVLRRA